MISKLSSSSMKDSGKRNSYRKNSYQGLEANFKREMLSPESLRSMGFSSQDIPLLQSFDQSMLNRTTGTQFNGQQCDQHATSSAMVHIKDQANVFLGQQASGISETNHSRINVPEGVTDEKVARKRQRDREYRERCKKAKMQMKDNLEALTGQKEDLEKKNESLQRENALMNQTLEPREEEMKKLRNELNNVKYKHEKQNRLVQTLSSEILKARMQMNENLEALAGQKEDLEKKNESLQREKALMNQALESQEEEMKKLRNELNNMQNMLAQTLSSEILTNPDLQLENQKPKDENVRLKKNAKMDDCSSHLIEENGKLPCENTIFRVQYDALCEKIANDINRRKK